MATPLALHIQDATLAYANVPVFANLNLKLAAGKWTALLGPSGVGKTTLLRMIAHLTTPKENATGKISVDQPLAAHEQISYMAQTDLLLPWLTTLDNATLNLKLRRHNKFEFAAEMQKAELLLKQVGLGHALDLYPHQLSGGMRQRVALVRTLLTDKPIILMDEPFSALDAITRYNLQELAAQLLKNKTVLFITHDPIEALRLADTIYIMQGQPANIKAFATLNSPIPRSLSDADVIALQEKLFQQLAQAVEETTCN